MVIKNKKFSKCENIEDIVRKKLSTKNEITWCPGCENFLILEAVKRAILKIISEYEGYKLENLVIVSGIGCHQKIYDYLNLSGIYGLHGRVLPLSLGIKLGNPNLTVIGFAGDGDAYADGMEHFVHIGRFNPNMTYVVVDNRNFALTTGQSTPTSPKGFKSKIEPSGNVNDPINPIKIALASNISFVARAIPTDLNHLSEILEKAIKHRGFSFVEILMDCLVFAPDNLKNKKFYKVENRDIKKAFELAEEWNYEDTEGKIPIGVIYKKEKPILEEKIPQLKRLIEKNIGWCDLKKQ